MKYFIISFLGCFLLFYFLGIFDGFNSDENSGIKPKINYRINTALANSSEPIKNEKNKIDEAKELDDTTTTLVAINDAGGIDVAPQKKSTSQRKRDSLAIEEIKTVFGEIISEASKTFDLEEEIIASLIFVESRGKIFATSDSGACGLTQLMPATARSLGISRADIYDPRQNILGGAKYLRLQLDRYDNNLDLALMAYNRGPAKLDSLLRSGVLKSTSYVSSIKYAMTLARAD